MLQTIWNELDYLIWWAGRGGLMPWPLRSPELSLLDFFCADLHII